MTRFIPLVISSQVKDRAFLLILILIACAGGAFAFPTSYLTNSNELVGFLLIPFVITIQKDKRFNLVYLSFFILFGIGTWFYHIRLFYFFTLAFFILWSAEMLIGRLTILVVFLLLFMSPVFHQVTVIMGFPIRLRLSQLAGTLLQWTDMAIQTEGNTIILDGNDFTVDEACMGLNMLAFSMLMGTFMISSLCRMSGKLLKFYWLMIFFSIALTLNIIANLFRIIILAFFKVVPENPLHEPIGILCLILYVLIPLFLIGKSMVAKYGQSQPTMSEKMIAVNAPGRVSLIVAAIALFTLGWYLNKIKSESIHAHLTLNAPGFKTEELDHEVTKIANESILIYIKSIPEFFSGEHTPLICWKGSGYKFKSIRTIRIGEGEIYLGQLTHNSENLYTAWWYDNGAVKTISQLDWRTRMALGEPKFSLVNVTAVDSQQLMEKVKIILHDGFFKINGN